MTTAENIEYLDKLLNGTKALYAEKAQLADETAQLVGKLSKCTDIIEEQTILLRACEIISRLKKIHKLLSDNAKSIKFCTKYGANSDFIGLSIAKMAKNDNIAPTIKAEIQAILVDMENEYGI